jgi:3D (Asp-Asp-Asp) domain-containing protein
MNKPAARRRPLGHFRMTAYTRYAKSSGRTASGTRPDHQRTVAVDPRVIPLGTKIEIEGIGIRIAEDTGRLIKGKKLDIFLPSVHACSRFGVRSRKVYIVD